MRVIRLLPIGLIFACLGLLVASPQRDVSAREARQIGKDRQKEARGKAKRAQREATQRQKEVARDIKRRDKERRRENKQLTKSRRKQGKQVEAQVTQPEKPPSPTKNDGPNRDQLSPLERLRGYSDNEPNQ